MNIILENYHMTHIFVVITVCPSYCTCGIRDIICRFTPAKKLMVKFYVQLLTSLSPGVYASSALLLLLSNTRETNVNKGNIRELMNDDQITRIFISMMLINMENLCTQARIWLHSLGRQPLGVCIHDLSLCCSMLW